MPARELATTVMQKIKSIAGPNQATVPETDLKISRDFPLGSHSSNRLLRIRFTTIMRTIFSLPRLALVGLVLLLMAAPSFFTINYLKKQARAITEDTLPGLSFAGAANANLAQAFNRTLMLLLSDDPAQRIQLKKEIEGFSQKTTAYLDAYKQSIFAPEDLAQFNALMNQRAEYLRVRERTLALSDMNKRAEAIDLYNSQLLPAYQRYKEAGDKLFCYNTQQGESRGKRIITGFSVTQFLVGGMGVILFVIGFAFGTSRRSLDYAAGEYA
jgi:methyl-accepting chemotaxis protein WspA